MKFFDRICETVTRALGLTALSPYADDGVSQRPLQNPVIQEAIFPTSNGPPLAADTLQSTHPWRPKPKLPPSPVFSLPNSSPGFTCNYSAMRGWKHTAAFGNRILWLEKSISKDDPRVYHLNVTDHAISADGVTRRNGGEIFNLQYPGPWIEACWGDTVEITVENHLKYNGTTIHWQWVGMLNQFEMDGVNGITQCPITPGDEFTYKFRVAQYSNSWYHSHYSLQYADGLAGPMTFHGPSSADYDAALDSFLFSDWSHNSAFEDYGLELRKPPIKMQAVILNGKGFYNCSISQPPNQNCNDTLAPSIFEQVFQRGRKYLLRLINTSTASTFIFSIDKHMLQVVGMDFVTIEPYYLVEARPSNDLIPTEDQNYWIRIVGAAGCSDIEEGQQNELLGIIRYNAGSTKRPITTSYQFSKEFSDEPYPSIVPVVPQPVSAREHPANDVDHDYGDNFEACFEAPSINYNVPHGNFSRWDIIDQQPMWLEFGDLTINHFTDQHWINGNHAIITENYGKDHWVHLIVTAKGTTKQLAEGKRQFVPVAHPIHLHGHDFMPLAQETATSTWMT